VGEPERCVVIDGARDADSVHADVMAALRKRVGLPGDRNG
jgi:thymidylate kinase